MLYSRATWNTFINPFSQEHQSLSKESKIVNYNLIMFTLEYFSYYAYVLKPETRISLP